MLKERKSKWTTKLYVAFFVGVFGGIFSEINHQESWPCKRQFGRLWEHYGATRMNYKKHSVRHYSTTLEEVIQCQSLKFTGCIHFMTSSVRNQISSEVLTRNLPNFQGLLNDSAGVVWISISSLVLGILVRKEKIRNIRNS